MKKLWAIAAGSTLVYAVLARISHQPDHNPDVSPSVPGEPAESRLAG